MCAQQTPQPISTTMNVAIIDNYDSFTFNLVHLIASLGANVTVLKNDDLILPTSNTTIRLCLAQGQDFLRRQGKRWM